ncbi:protein GVQW3-like [Sipha flava]|uniref:Protein GVQW3-like n=1 Tax=Sipha flava TaxID=143950 RepID=A0A8B8F2Y7_9HEMI|nr:protein GVQW3-like [Sipha flava]
MLDLKIEQRVNIKFLVKLKKTATESFRMLNEVYGEECLSRARVFEWYKRFCSGREDVEDDDRPGRPTTSSTKENIEKIDQIIRQDRRLSVRAVEEMINIDRKSIRRILVENLNMKKVCQNGP